MADRFHTEDYDKLCRICCQFLGEENYNKENHKHKIEKIYFININIGDPQIHPKNLSQMLLSNVYCRQNVKYHKHINIQELD